MTIGVLCMAYGSPRTPDETAAYLKDIRGGREPSAEAVASLVCRYARIGGRSPLLDITTRQVVALNERLGPAAVVRVGMKHWHPYIADAVDAFARDGIDMLVGLALAPHYSGMSIGGYEQRLRKAAVDAGLRCDVRMVHSWYDVPSFVAFAARTLRATLEGSDGRATRVIFTAHSLPERILAQGDPYLDQLLASSRLIAEHARIADHEFAFQSAGRTGEPWLGPDLAERLEAAAADGVRRVVVHPIGFTADHLEILYDIDVACAERAAALGIELKRTPSPNDDAAFVAALADVVRMAAA
jgi:ferrochelatase